MSWSLDGEKSKVSSLEMEEPRLRDLELVDGPDEARTLGFHLAPVAAEAEKYLLTRFLFGEREIWGIADYFREATS